MRRTRQEFGRFRWLILILLTAAGGMGLPVETAGQEQVSLRGDEVAVFNLAGEVEVLSGGGDQVIVEIMRGGSEASRLDLITREVDGREALVVRYPEDRVIYPEMGRGTTGVRVGDDGTFYRGEEGWFGRRVRIAGSGRGLEAWADLRIRVPRGRDVALYLAVGRTDVRDVEGDLLVDTGSGTVETRGTRGELEIDTGSGSVVVRDARGELWIDTGSGGVELTDIQGGDVEVDTGSGSVRGSRITASAFRVDTGSGEIALEEVSCPEMELDTGSGAVDVEVLTDVDELTVDTGSGSITVRLPASVGARIEVDSGSGQIDVDLPVEVQEMERDHLRGILGDGRGEITLDTGSGGVRITGG